MKTKIKQLGIYSKTRKREKGFLERNSKKEKSSLVQLIYILQTVQERKTVTATHSQLKMTYPYKTKSYRINLESITTKLSKFYVILMMKRIIKVKKNCKPRKR